MSTPRRPGLSSPSAETSNRACARTASTSSVPTATSARTTARAAGSASPPAAWARAGARSLPQLRPHRLGHARLPAGRRPDRRLAVREPRVVGRVHREPAGRAAFGDQVAFHIGWSWQDRKTHHGQLAVRGREIRMRLRRADRTFEAATPCTADKCLGRRWTLVANAADLLALHTHGPGRATSPCDRCGPNARGPFPPTTPLPLIGDHDACGRRRCLLHRLGHTVPPIPGPSTRSAGHRPIPDGTITCDISERHVGHADTAARGPA